MATCSSADSVLEAASQIKSNATKLNTFVNGTSDQTVQLGTGNPTPTLRKLAADAQDIIALAANDAAETALDAIAANTQNKADKVYNATYGNLASLNHAGNLMDSGYAAEDFVLLLDYAANEALETAAFAKSCMEDFARWREAGRNLVLQADSGCSSKALAASVGMDSLLAFKAERRRRLGSTTLDGKPVFFIVAGQSNALGYGSVGGMYAPAQQAGRFYSASSETVEPLRDPAMSGSIGPWPAFANAFFDLTGREALLLNAAVGGSGVCDYGERYPNTWADSAYGTCRPRASQLYAAAVGAFAADGIEYDFGGLLWSQGELETGQIGDGNVTVAEYKAATLDVFDFFRTLTGVASLPVLVSMTGYPTEALTSAEYRANYFTVQKAQRDLCCENAQNGVHMAFDLAPFFVNWGYLSDRVHYSRRGYDIMGRSMAVYAATFLDF